MDPSRNRSRPGRGLVHFSAESLEHHDKPWTENTDLPPSLPRSSVVAWGGSGNKVESMQENTHDLVVIGGGPAGYMAALRAAELGLQTACVDENDVLGGTCLRVGCIPSKALLESSEKYVEAQQALAKHGVKVAAVELDLATLLNRKSDVVRTLTRGIDALFKQRKVQRYLGRGRFDGPGRLVVDTASGPQMLRAKHYLIAAGSRPATLPMVELDGQSVITSTEALSLSEVPKHLVVIGGGYIGLELGSVWKRLGAQVTVVEVLDRVLPGMDADLAEHAKRMLEKQGLVFRLGSKIQRAYAQDGRCFVDLEGTAPLECDRILLAVGRAPNTDKLGLETIGVKLDEKGRIPVDPWFATTAQGVFAVGDCIGGMMLAHKASDEAVACVDKIVTGHARMNYEAIPAVVYTHPEIASVGKTEQQLQSAGHAYRKGQYWFRANGRALTLGESDGFVKILADQQTDRVLGVHILHARAGDLIAEAAVAIEFGASAEDLALCSHAHPTLAEAVRDAAIAAQPKPEKK